MNATLLLSFVTNFNELSYFLALDGYHKLTVSLTGTRREREKFFGM